MNILPDTVVSVAEVTNKYKYCKEKAEGAGKIFVMHNNHPDAVLLSIAEYEKLSAVIEYLERSEAKDIEKVIMSLPKAGNRKTYLIENMKKDLNLQQKI